MKGKRLLVRYPDAGESLWHERLLVEPVGVVGASSWRWIVVTPTLDVHEEDFSDQQVEVMQVGRRGGVPDGLARQRLFRFDERELEDNEDWIEVEAAHFAGGAASC